jgi:uncharacterized RDD family membrane protein YckC
MNWYYVDAGQQAGPVEDAQLEELQRAGRIQADTLVWHEGMANWQPYSEAKSPGLRLATSAPSVGSPTEPATDGVCAECNRIFSTDDMIRHGDVLICADCKPIFMQKLAEGASLHTAALSYAGFWIRFAAIFLDWIILWVINMAIGLVAGLSFGQALGVEAPTMLGLQIVLTLVQLSIGVAYETVMIGKYGATLGKMACKIRVVTADGGRVTYLRAFARYFAKILSGLICLIGYIMAAFDSEKRALHDHICSTRVVVK